MDHTASKVKGLLWVGIACLLAAGFASGLAPLAHVVPWSWEKKIASISDADIERLSCTGTAQSQEVLKKLVTRIYPIDDKDALFSIDVKIVKNSEINAYAMLGGNIAINSGLLKQAQSPEEVAGVLAHEISHVAHRHILQGAITHIITYEGVYIMFGGQTPGSDMTNYFLNMSFTRSQEAQADKGGLERLQKAHVDNEGFKHFFERMEKAQISVSFLSDHPSNDDRIEMVKQYANQDIKPILTEEEWLALKNYCN